MAKKATKAQIEARVNEVMQMIGNGIERPAILEHISKKHDISHKTVDFYIGKANQRFTELAEQERAWMIGLSAWRLNNIYMKASKVQDWRVAIQAEKTKIDLFGLAAPKQIEISHKLSRAENALLADLLALLERHDIIPGEMFEAMILEIAAIAQDAQGVERSSTEGRTAAPRAGANRR